MSVAVAAKGAYEGEIITGIHCRSRVLHNVLSGSFVCLSVCGAVSLLPLVPAASHSFEV